jgi:hypothetical protein
VAPTPISTKARTHSDFDEGPDYVQMPPFDTFRDVESGDVETPQAQC